MYAMNCSYFYVRPYDRIEIFTHAGCIAAGVGRAFSCACLLVCLFAL